MEEQKLQEVQGVEPNKPKRGRPRTKPITLSKREALEAWEKETEGCDVFELMELKKRKREERWRNAVNEAKKLMENPEKRLELARQITAKIPEPEEFPKELCLEMGKDYEVKDVCEMMVYPERSCVLLGPKWVKITKDVEERTARALEAFIKTRQIECFLFGKMGVWEALCFKILRNLQKTEYPYIRLISFRMYYEAYLTEEELLHIKRMYQKVCGYEPRITLYVFDGVYKCPKFWRWGGRIEMNHLDRVQKMLTHAQNVLMWTPRERAPKVPPEVEAWRRGEKDLFKLMFSDPFRIAHTFSIARAYAKKGRVVFNACLEELPEKFIQPRVRYSDAERKFLRTLKPPPKIAFAGFYREKYLIAKAREEVNERDKKEKARMEKHFKEGRKVYHITDGPLKELTFEEYLIEFEKLQKRRDEKIKQQEEKMQKESWKPSEYALAVEKQKKANKK